MSETTTRAKAGVPRERGVPAFMNRGGIWRFVAFLAVYLVLYLASGKVIALLFPDAARADPLSSAASAFVQLGFPVVFGGVLLFAVASWLGWTAELFGRQPVARSRWMWLGPVVALSPIVLRVLGIEWSSHPLSVIVTVMGIGLCIGFTEELLFRGFAVKMVRDGGHGELVVAAVAAVTFSLSHSVNAFNGQPLLTVGVTVLYTLGFGVLMYLTLRVTGFLLWAMLLHGLTDPTTALASGGIDIVTSAGSDNALLSLGGYLTLPLAFTGIIALFFVRGRAGTAQERAGSATEAREVTT